MDLTTFKTTKPMNQTKTILTAIIEHIIGKKYYANIINTRGTDRCEISSIIFTSRQAAERHKKELSTTISYQWIETVSFRSRIEYDPNVKRYSAPSE